jgi:hypothetical protein
MGDFLTLRNFILAISALIGVILFVITIMRWVGSVNSEVSGAKSYTTTQLIMMFIVSMLLISSVTYMDMGSRTLFGSNAYTVAASDPWIVGTNIKGVLSQLGIASTDTDSLSRIVAIFFMSMKALGLGIFVFTLSHWYRLSSGEGELSLGSLSGYFILSVLFWNFGTVVQMLSYQLGHQIQI